MLKHIGTFARVPCTPAANTLCVLVVLFFAALAARAGEPTHGHAMHGAPKYAADFTHFDYVNPQAPKGGSIRQAATGTFDSLNPFILKGVSAAGIGQVFQTLTSDSSDEAFSQYGDVAISIEAAEDNTWVAYQLHPQARWHDGKPITADDVVFSFNTLKTKGHPFYRSYFGSVERVEKLGERHIKFHFSSADNAELRMIMGQLPVLPKHYYESREFNKTTLDPPLGSGPYRVVELDAGRSITYERVKDWWGKDLPVNRGRYNIDRIRYDYYRDGTIALEAFKSGEYDFRVENNSKLWATSYQGPPFKRGDIVTELIAHERPTGMQAFIFNSRRAPFNDIKVRQALAYAFDFEWTNKNLFYGQYTRSTSYFSNSELASSGLPSAREMEILQPFRDQLPPELFTSTYQPPSSDIKGGMRTNLRRALSIFKQAGYEVRDKQLVNTASGEPLSFEILLVQPAFERVVLPFRSNLERLGVSVKVRTVDSAQYQKRMDKFDFDMVINGFGQSLSPGNEQRDFWGSANADVDGSRNFIGIKSKAVDALIEKVISAPDREELVQRTRALDRALLWGHYVIPNWHIQSYRVAYWNKFSRPAVSPKYALGFDTWWFNRENAAKLTR
ncbi:MAG: microcin C transport system substrate-binding protein [Gammaproteobacteria bacterium]|jgi:microcin C transport system substrate-binding protein